MTKDEIRIRIQQLQDEIEDLESQLWAPSAEEIEEQRERHRKYQESLKAFEGLDNDALAVAAIAEFPSNYIDALKVIRDVSKLGLKEAKELMDKHLGR